VGDGREGAHVLAWVVAVAAGRREAEAEARGRGGQIGEAAIPAVGVLLRRRVGRAQAMTGERVRGVCWCGMGDGRGAAVGIPVGVEECARVPGMCWVSWSGSWRWELSARRLESLACLGREMGHGLRGGLEFEARRRDDAGPSSKVELARAGQGWSRADHRDI
jgi:hypothetical protein